MTKIDIHAEAERHADRVAPRPKYDPIAIGIVSAMATYLGLIAFAILADLREHQTGWQIDVMVAAAFLIPFGLGKLAERRHGHAYVDAFQRLKDGTEVPL